MPRTDSTLPRDADQASVIALSALVWILEQPGRASRLLDLTGLTPQALREGACDPAVLAAMLGFLATYEPDLIACAEAIGQSPAALILARDILES